MGFISQSLKKGKTMKKIDLLSSTLEEITNTMKELGEPAFRGKQFYQWMHQKQIFEFDQMTNLSKKLIEKIKDIAVIQLPKIVEIQKSKLDETQKFLFELKDGNMVESVLMKYKHGNTVCISSQVGCKMGCKFCASTLDGWIRNLNPGEMLAQVYQIQTYTQERVSNVVVMGTGEPLDNYDHLLTFIQMLTDEDGLHISQRNITVSTCGIVPKIEELAKEHLQITLALSLHASTQKTREELMPIASRYPMHEVVQACKNYFFETGRRITFEYGLVGGINDSPKEAEQLGKLIGGMNCHMNLIPINPIKERDYVQSDPKVIQSFKNKLEKSGINVTIRREMGRDIDGACGQLRQKHLER